MESGVQFVAADFPQANELTVHLLSAMAQFEAKAISERTRAALRAAKARGVVLGGRRNLTDDDLATMAAKGRIASAAKRRERAEKHASDLLPVVEHIRDNGAASLRDIAAQLVNATERLSLSSFATISFAR